MYSSSDEESEIDYNFYIEAIDFMNALPQPRRLLDRSNPLNEYDDVEFRMRFRLPKASVLDLLELISDRLSFASRRNRAVNPISQLLITLRFYACASFQLVIADLSGVSQPTISRIIKRVSKCLASLVLQEISFPTTPVQRSQTMRAFYSIANFPATLGAIDCTHVAISSPGGDQAELFRNRKGYFSINVQAVCNASLRITNLVARWPGSAHDSTIFRNSRLCAQFEASEISGGHLVGDGGYACSRYLLTPLAATRTDPEQRYNCAQIRTRNPIERAFGVVKRRFPCLHLGLRLKLSTTLDVIVACFVLHNVALRDGDAEAPDDGALIAGRRVFEEVPRLQTAGRAVAPGASSLRTALINGVFARFDMPPQDW